MRRIRVRTCVHCKRQLALHMYPKSYYIKVDGSQSTKGKNYCKDCYNSYIKEWRLKTKYGITNKDLTELRQKQNDKCAICDVKFTGYDGKHYKHTAMVVDHSHSTNEIRGLLCHGCNIGLGKFKDSADLLSSALAYILTTDEKVSDLSDFVKDVS